MKSRYSHVLMLLGAILAFVPIMAVDYLLDGYVHMREKAGAQYYVNAVSAQIETSTVDAIAVLGQVLAESPSLCTPTFIDIIQQAIQTSVNIKQILVQNADGVQYCDAYGHAVAFSRLSETLPISGKSETITLVKLGDMTMPALQIAQVHNQTRQVSAFVPLSGQSEQSLGQALSPSAVLRIVLTNGIPILTIGDPTAFDAAGSAAQFVSATGFAGELPLRVEYALPFDVARARYADLDIGFTIIACLMSGAFLLLALHYVRHSRVPAFDLERAIARGEIKPYYQPVINLRTGHLEGCEVLCRWEKKKGEIVSPATFIDYAESTGLAIPMTLSLMQQVKFDLGDICQQMGDLKVSINLFEGHFRDTAILEDVEAIYGNSPIAFRQLVFEITERQPLANSAIAKSVIAGLQALGCRLAMDDAGTGHSNLAYLATLGVDIIKIDRIFVEMIKPGTTQVPVLDGLIAMGRDLACEIVAEGVQTETQALYLRSRGVVHAQGFIFAPALKAPAFRQLALALHAAHKPRSAIADLAASAA